MTIFVHDTAKTVLSPFLKVPRMVPHVHRSGTLDFSFSHYIPKPVGDSVFWAAAFPEGDGPATLLFQLFLLLPSFEPSRPVMSGLWVLPDTLLSLGS
jgi:hypothetical protein